MKWLFRISPIPAVIGIGLSFYFANQLDELPVIFFRIDIATLAVILGLLITALLALVYFVLSKTKQKIQKSAKDERENAASNHRRFIRSLDHEVKNPLTAIRIELASLKSEASSGDVQLTIERIETQIRRLSHLTGDLRKLADLDTLELEVSEVDLTVLLKDIVDTVQSEKERQLHLVLPSAPWPLSSIQGDWDLLDLMIYNLVDNAVKYSDADSIIEVRASEDDNYVVIEIADTGIGILQDETQLVWSELSRGSNVLHREGSGLGLALVQAIATRHQGAVTLRSRSGKGTVFTVRLPQSSS